MGLQIIPPLELAISPFVLVLDMRRVAFDLQLLYTASAPLGLGKEVLGCLGGVCSVTVYSVIGRILFSVFLSRPS
jgi:hypothetical protein